MTPSKFEVKYIIISICVAAFSVLTTVGQTASLIANNAFPSVVMIQTKDKSGAVKSFGSGFFVRPNIVATNYHVIRGVSAASLKQVGNSKTYSVDGIVGIDKTNDLALLSIRALTGKPLPLVTDLTKIDIGDDIFALGSPKGLEGTISPGIISSKGLRRIGQENLIQISAPISRGSSGGPVVNKLGQVIGVASASLESGQNLNFAVPAVYVGILLNGTMEFKSFSAFRESELPSLKETTDWLTIILSGLRGPTYSDAVITDTRITFKGCRFEYVEISDVGSGNEVISVYKNSAGSLTDLKYIGMPPGSWVLKNPNQINGAFLAFTFNERSIDESMIWPTRPKDNYRAFSNSLAIYLDDKRLAQEVEKAFSRLRTLCAGP